MVENNSAYDPQSPDQTERSWLGWTARILGTLIAVIWLLVVFVSNLNEPWSDETFILIALVIMSTTDVALAWWRADLGGLALMTTALAHGVFAYLASDHNQGFAIAIRAGPFLIVGLLFIAAWQYSGRRTGL